jgi:hypothetical protein
MVARINPASNADRESATPPLSGSSMLRFPQRQ